MDQRSAILRSIVLAGVLTLFASPAAPASAATNAAVALAYDGILKQHQQGDRLALRVRQDATRNRLWVLTAGDVYVYDTAKLELIRRIRLPNWSTADFICPPDIALDEAGAAFVSSNIEPRLFQIGPAGFREKEHRLKLVSHRNMDVGFGALSFGPDGRLRASSALAGSLFVIDLARGTATEVASSQPSDCDAR